VWSLSETRDISLLLFNTPLFTYYPTLLQPSHINYTFQHQPQEQREMPVTVTPVAKPVAGIDFPVNHEMFPNDCESIGCTKIEGRYRPRSWVLITNKYDEYEEENFEVENFVCIECNEKCKRSFNGQKVLKRKEVMPVLNVTPCHKPFAQNTCFAHVSSLVTPHVDKDTLYPASCRTHVL
jgi:hypothetical protein